ncbi:MAG: aminotransferase class V-fold PLP-dependent enzyme [Thermomicrobiales bacterium]
MPRSLLRACWDARQALHDHRRAPLLNLLRDARERNLTSFSCPGHKGGSGADPEFVEHLGSDLLASDLWLNAGSFSRALRAAERLGADAWGAERAFYLVNGSSSGNHALLMAALGPGDEIVVARDIHASLLTALILTGARPVYVTPRFDPATGISTGIHPADVAITLDRHPRAKLVALVRPNYYGATSDLPGIVREAHSRGVPVYVDEAWGPHLHFHPALPGSALASGADAAVTSAHKLLGSLSQASLLLLRGPRLDHARVATAVAMTQTTSPLLPVLVSIDTARRQMALDGELLVERTIHLSHDARRRISQLPGISVLDGIEGLDRTRLVIDVRGLGLTGYAAERLLRNRLGIAPEMSDHMNVVCLISIGDTPRVSSGWLAGLASWSGIADPPPRSPDRTIGAP